jgi:hypothetical protein
MDNHCKDKSDAKGSFRFASFLQREFLYDASVKEVDDTIGVRCIMTAVGYHYDSGALLVELLQKVHNLLTVH